MSVQKAACGPPGPPIRDRRYLIWRDYRSWYQPVAPADACTLAHTGDGTFIFEEYANPASFYFWFSEVQMQNALVNSSASAGYFYAYTNTKFNFYDGSGLLRVEATHPYPSFNGFYVDSRNT